MENELEIYTDGSCLNNPGPGGWAAVIITENDIIKIADGYRLTTNNRMEMLAVIKAIDKAVELGFKSMEIHSDSRLIVDAVNQNWLKGWIKRNWRKADKKPVLNKDLWQEIVKRLTNYNIKITKVPAHSGIEYNELCDELAKDAASGKNLNIDSKYESENSNENLFSHTEVKTKDKNETTIDIVTISGIKYVSIKQGRNKVKLPLKELQNKIEA